MIKGKLILIVLTSVLILSIVAFLVIIQNTKTSRVLDKISNLRIPVPILTSDIISGANRVSASQRAYMMTGLDVHKKDRIAIWANQILPATDSLMALREFMQVEEHVLITDQTFKMVRKYQKLQDEIDLFFERNLKNFELNFESYDSVGHTRLIGQLKYKETLEAKLDSLVAGEASRVRAELRNVVMPLNQAQEDLLKSDNSNVQQTLIVTSVTLIITFIIGLAAIITIALILYQSINKSIKQPTGVLKGMARGILPSSTSNSNDELNEIFMATNTLASNMSAASNFAAAIGEGQFDYKFNAASSDDVLGNSLLQMRERLKEFSEEERKNSWASKGLADLGALIRKENDDESMLYDQIISFTVNYLNINQGALFIREESNETIKLNLASTYAYGRKKHMNESVLPGQGLIGQVFLEKETKYLLDVPSNYVNITSGLGEATPTCLVLIPLIINEECFGVMELASFNKLEKFEVSFLEELCKTIASTISSVRINTKTQTLLAETQQQAEEMKAQEEELRQNMEEMTATQEEMQRVQSRVEQTLEQAVDAVISIDDNKLITFFNKAAENMFGYDRKEVIGKNVKNIVPIEHQRNHDQYIDNNIRTGENKVVGKGRIVEMTDKSGNRSEVFLSLSKIVSDSGVQYTAFIKDLKQVRHLISDSKN